MHKLCEKANLQSERLWVCNDTNLGTEIVTPLSYPDGEAIVLYAFEKSGQVALHDGGMAAYNLAKWGQNFTQKISSKAVGYAKMYGCEMREDRVFRACTVENLHLAIFTAASVCQFIASHVPFDDRRKVEFEEKVIDVLNSMDFRKGIELRPKLQGDTGHEYRTTAAILLPSGDKFAAIIDAISSSRSVASKFRAMYDIKRNSLYEKTERISVIDDSEEFPEGDIPLLQDVSNTVLFSALPKRLEAYAPR